MPKQTWHSPHGTTWEAETYEEALEAERDSLAAQLEEAQEKERRLAEALRDLHAEVEMGESVGICLKDRVPSLRAGQLLDALDSHTHGGDLENKRTNTATVGGIIIRPVRPPDSQTQGGSDD